MNGDLAIVGVPGEPFCQHAVRLRQRAYLPTVLVFGYCNDHLLYFPTIEAASEGGYGADPQVSPIALGAGETMMNQALISIYRLVGKFPGQPVSEPSPAPAGPSPVKVKRLPPGQHGDGLALDSDRHVESGIHRVEPGIHALDAAQAGGCQPASAQSSPLTAELQIMK